MASKRSNLYLYLTLACFLGLIAIFIFDGYMGVYDTLYINAGEQVQKIETDSLQRQRSFRTAGGNRGEKATFRYEIANRQFSGYTADVAVSVWHSQEKVLDVTLQPVAIASFATGQVEWVVDSSDILPADFPAEQRYEYTVIIQRGNIERRVIIYINPSPYLLKPAPPVPAR